MMSSNKRANLHLSEFTGVDMYENSKALQTLALMNPEINLGYPDGFNIPCVTKVYETTFNQVIENSEMMLVCQLMAQGNVLAYVYTKVEDSWVPTGSIKTIESMTNLTKMRTCASEICVTSNTISTTNANLSGAITAVCMYDLPNLDNLSYDKLAKYTMGPQYCRAAVPLSTGVCLHSFATPDNPMVDKENFNYELDRTDGWNWSHRSAAPVIRPPKAYKPSQGFKVMVDTAFTPNPEYVPGPTVTIYVQLVDDDENVISTFAQYTLVIGQILYVPNPYKDDVDPTHSVRISCATEGPSLQATTEHTVELWPAKQVTMRVAAVDPILGNNDKMKHILIIQGSIGTKNITISGMQRSQFLPVIDNIPQLDVTIKPAFDPSVFELYNVLVQTGNYSLVMTKPEYIAFVANTYNISDVVLTGSATTGSASIVGAISSIVPLWKGAIAAMKKFGIQPANLLRRGSNFLNQAVNSGINYLESSGFASDSGHASDPEPVYINVDEVPDLTESFKNEEQQDEEHQTELDLAKMEIEKLKKQLTEVNHTNDILQQKISEAADTIHEQKETIAKLQQGENSDTVDDEVVKQLEELEKTNFDLATKLRKAQEMSNIDLTVIRNLRQEKEKLQKEVTDVRAEFGKVSYAFRENFKKLTRDNFVNHVMKVEARKDFSKVAEQLFEMNMKSEHPIKMKVPPHKYLRGEPLRKFCQKLITKKAWDIVSTEPENMLLLPPELATRMRAVGWDPTRESRHCFDCSGDYMVPGAYAPVLENVTGPMEDAKYGFIVGEKPRQPETMYYVTLDNNGRKQVRFIDKIPPLSPAGRNIVNTIRNQTPEIIRNPDPRMFGFDIPTQAQQQTHTINTQHPEESGHASTEFQIIESFEDVPDLETLLHSNQQNNNNTVHQAFNVRNQFMSNELPDVVSMSDIRRTIQGSGSAAPPKGGNQGPDKPKKSDNIVDNDANHIEEATQQKVGDVPALDELFQVEEAKSGITQGADEKKPDEQPPQPRMTPQEVNEIYDSIKDKLPGDLRTQIDGMGLRAEKLMQLDFTVQDIVEHWLYWEYNDVVHTFKKSWLQLPYAAKIRNHSFFVCIYNKAPFLGMVTVSFDRDSDISYTQYGPFYIDNKWKPTKDQADTFKLYTLGQPMCQALRSKLKKEGMSMFIRFDFPKACTMSDFDGGSWNGAFLAACFAKDSLMIYEASFAAVAWDISGERKQAYTFYTSLNYVGELPKKLALLQGDSKFFQKLADVTGNISMVCATFPTAVIPMIDKASEHGETVGGTLSMGIGAYTPDVYIVPPDEKYFLACVRPRVREILKPAKQVVQVELVDIVAKIADWVPELTYKSGGQEVTVKVADALTEIMDSADDPSTNKYYNKLANLIGPYNRFNRLRSGVRKDVWKEADEKAQGELISQLIGIIKPYYNIKHPVAASKKEKVFIDTKGDLLASAAKKVNNNIVKDFQSRKVNPSPVSGFVKRKEKNYHLVETD